MSLDSTFTDLASRGWLVNNLYQYDNTSWRINLRRPAPDGDWFTDWAEAPTLEDALEECMSKLNDAEFFPNRETLVSAAPGLITNLAERLGFVPKPPTIARRQ